MDFPALSKLFSHVKPAANATVASAAPAATATATATPAPAVTPTLQPPPQPLAEFKDIWTAPNPDPNKPQEIPSVFAVTQAQIMEAARKTDFSRAVPAETLTAILAGGEGAAAKLQDALTAVAQHTYGQAAFASTKILERGLQEAEARVMAKTEEKFRSLSLNTELRAENPLFSNPAVQPIMEALQSQLITKFPQATPAELSTMAKQYVSALGQSFAPPPVVVPKNGPVETDWNKFFEQPTTT